MSNLNYPTSIEDVDNFAPYNFIYDEYEKFQVCHTKIGNDMNFVVIMRVVDSRMDADGTITINGFELMVVHGFYSKDNLFVALDMADVINNPPVSLFYSEKDELHHGPLVNFKIKITTIDPLHVGVVPPVYYYARPFKINTAIGEKLHFVMEGLDIELDKANSKGRMCLVNTPVAKGSGSKINPQTKEVAPEGMVWVSYEEWEKLKKLKDATKTNP